MKGRLNNSARNILNANWVKSVGEKAPLPNEKSPLGLYADGGNLYLQIQRARGEYNWRVNKSWIFRYYHDGRQRCMGIGPYPLIGLSEARERAGSHRKELEAAKYGQGVYPLELPTRHSVMSILTLDQALQRDQLAIREVGDGQVSRLSVRNDATLPVFLMAGELILGGKQNRMVRDDVLLPRQSGWLDITVYCGEQHRWRDGGGFKSGGSLSAPALRQMAASGAAQDRIWSTIGEQLDTAKVETPTASYQQLFESPELQRRLDACEVRLRPLPGPRTAGCIVVSRGRVIGGDLFSDPALFATLWPKLCRSYAAQGITPRPPIDLYHKRRPLPDGRDRVQRFLDALPHTRYSRRGTPGSGKLWQLNGAAEGTSLEHFGGVVHAGVFPARLTIQPMPRLHSEE